MAKSRFEGKQLKITYNGKTLFDARATKVELSQQRAILRVLDDSAPERLLCLIPGRTTTVTK